jgi:hypothetical protein
LGCAGAFEYLDEDLLLAGAELIWRAGAYQDEKGHGLCHGTSGNGFALLKGSRCTGDALARAGAPLRRPRPRPGGAYRDRERPPPRNTVGAAGLEHRHKPHRLASRVATRKSTTSTADGSLPALDINGSRRILLGVDFE